MLYYPGGKRFAFTIFDDCDGSTVENTRPFYELLERLGMRTTRAVWIFDSSESHPDWGRSRSLEDPEYKAFTQELQARAFEIAFHGTSMMSSPRHRTERALEVFREVFGHYPSTYANHGSNRENIYWSEARFRLPVLRALYALMRTRNIHLSEGHIPGSPYFWGDLCQKSITYVRGFTFPVLNLFSVHRNIVYRDADTEFVNFWFSASHAPDVKAFNDLVRPSRQRSLIRDGGVCIIATHLARGFVQSGEVNRDTRRILETLAENNGWYVPVSTLLDYLRQQGFGRPIPSRERYMLELRWLWHAIRRGVGN